MTIHSDRRTMVRMLGSLPIVAHFAKRLGIEETIDRHCPGRIYPEDRLRLVVEK